MSQNLEVNKKIERLLDRLFLEIPVIINFIQKDKNQKEYGCAYYPFWRKERDPLVPTPTSDFVNARWQELAYPLAFLYRSAFPGNRYYQDSQLGSLIKPVLLYWVHIQNRDGSFSEWLKDGHEYPPTAFGLQNMVETYKFCSDMFLEEERNKIEKAFHASATWLMNHNKRMAINHECGGTAALASIFGLFNLPKYKQGVEKKIDFILRYHDKEGWFREIDGPDTGYNTVSITQLALAYQNYRSERLEKIIEEVLNFNSYFVYPDNMMGGGMNSRLAMNLDPLGFAVLAQRSPLACTMAFSCLDAFVEGKIKGTYNRSDYQRCSMLGHMFLYCWWLYKSSQHGDLQKAQKKLPAQSAQNINHKFKNMGTAIVKTPLFYLVSGPGASLGAIYSYRAGETLIYSSPYELINNSGIYIDNVKEVYYSSNRGNSIKTKWGDNFQICWGRLIPISREQYSRWHHPGEGGIVKKKLRRHFPEVYDLLRDLNQVKGRWKRKIDLITRGIRFRRELFWKEKSIEVKNQIWCKRGQSLIIRENIRLPGYGNKNYKLIFNGQKAVSIDRNLDLEYNHLARIEVIIEGECYLTFVFPEPITIRITGYLEKEKIYTPFSDMNAWGLAIEMSPAKFARIRHLDYYIRLV